MTLLCVAVVVILSLDFITFSFDPVTQQPPLLVGTNKDYTRGDGGHGGALTDDEVNYCVPFLAS